MKFRWEEIYSNAKLTSCSYFEATYRAKVPGGWLVRHEACCNYQYGNDDLKEGPLVHVEGWLDIKNTITFFADPNYEWLIDD